MRPAQLSARKPYIDWARGLAVLLMMEAHTLDAWTRPASRPGKAFAYGAILGGFAAPLFLWLAGLSLALAASRLTRRGSRPAAVVDALVRRGLEIFILAFLFRLQAFIVSPGSYLVTLFRVDILNVMGPSMVIAGLVRGLVGERRRAAVVYAVLACFWAMVTPIVRVSPLAEWVPLWLQWYIRPSGDYTTFTLFPWAGFVFAGAACGVLLAGTEDHWSERRVLAGMAFAGIAAILVGFVTAARPSIYAESSFWTSSPTYFSIRVGILMLGLACLAMIERLLHTRHLEARALSRLGRSSLFVYWIHVELVYGYATWPLRRHLPLWGTALAFVVFAFAMYGAVVVKDRVVEAWRSRRRLSSDAGLGAVATN